MTVRFEFHYYTLSLLPYPLILRVYRMTTKPLPKRTRSGELVRPDYLAPKLKERSSYVLEQELPEDMRLLIKRLLKTNPR
jgi:hypothetical protein